MLSDAPDNSTVTLDRDYSISSTLTVSNSITLDFAGHVTCMTGSGGVLEPNNKVTSTDSNPTATHEDSSLPAGGVITGRFALLGVSAAGLSAAALYGKRRKGFRQ